MVDQMRAELVEQPQMRAFGDVIVVHRPEHRAEGIGIGHPPVAAGIARRDSAAAGACGSSSCLRRSRRRRGAPASPTSLPSSVKAVTVSACGTKQRATKPLADFLHAEHRERIAMHAGDDAPRRRSRGRPRLDWRGASSPAASRAVFFIVRQSTPPLSALALIAHATLASQSYQRGNVPDFLRIFPDGAVGGEPAHARDVADRLARTSPGCRARPRRPRAAPRHRRRNRRRP